MCQPVHPITIGGAIIIFPPLLRITAKVCARDVVVDADLDATEPGDVFLSHVSAIAIEAVCLLMIDSLDLETLMKLVLSRFVGVQTNRLRCGRKRMRRLAFQI
jgi:hypothetical protein